MKGWRQEGCHNGQRGGLISRARSFRQRHPDVPSSEMTLGCRTYSGTRSIAGEGEASPPDRRDLRGAHTKSRLRAGLASHSDPLLTLTKRCLSLVAALSSGGTQPCRRFVLILGDEVSRRVGTRQTQLRSNVAEFGRPSKKGEGGVRIFPLLKPIPSLERLRAIKLRGRYRRCRMLFAFLLRAPARAEQPRRFGFVALNAVPDGEAISQPHPSVWILALNRSAHPRQRSSVIGLDPDAVFEDRRQAELRVGIAALGGSTDPYEAFAIIFRNARAVVIHLTKPQLRRQESVLRRLRAPFRGDAIVVRRPAAVGTPIGVLAECELRARVVSVSALARPGFEFKKRVGSASLLGVKLAEVKSTPGAADIRDAMNQMRLADFRRRLSRAGRFKSSRGRGEDNHNRDDRDR